MDAEVFVKWLQNVFVPAADARNVKKPVLLLIDGHSTHVTYEASSICIANGKELYCLLEHASHILQPLDLRLFNTLKTNWRQAVCDWQSEHVGEFVTKSLFARVFKHAWERSTTLEIAIKEFQEEGIYPLDPSVVTKSVKITPSQMFHEATSKPSSSTSAPSPDSIPIATPISQTSGPTNEHKPRHESNSMVALPDATEQPCEIDLDNTRAEGLVVSTGPVLSTQTKDGLIVPTQAADGPGPVIPT